jgi:hypothetical protein
MFIDSRVWRPGRGDGDEEEPPQPRREYDIPWRAIGWTLVIVWLFIASSVTGSDLLAAGLAYTGVLIAFWRGFAWLGRTMNGMHDHKQ